MDEINHTFECIKKKFYIPPWPNLKAATEAEVFQNYIKKENFISQESSILLMGHIETQLAKIYER